MKKLTAYGEFIRILRIQHQEVMSDTAKLLGVTIPFVSAVENGKRNVPEDWLDILITHYQLSLEEQTRLQQAIEDSKTQIKIDLVHSQNFQRNIALQFQRSFDNLDEKTANEIIKLLNKEGLN